MEKKYYWSNCIIEAIRAKRENPTIRLLIIWPWQNEVWCPHLMWTDDVYEYDFHATDIPAYGWIWHQGYIRTKPLGWCQSYIDGLKSLRSHHKTKRNKIEDYNSIVLYGDRSHAEGNTAIASGDYSHAEGRETIAFGSYPHMGG